ILESPKPLANYVATMRVTPITVGNRSIAEWWAEFEVTSGPEHVQVSDIGDNVFVVGFAAMNRKLAKK
ncbi:MAG: SRPBCC family protein, partial [Gammaproteobacteria bacterium]